MGGKGYKPYTSLTGKKVSGDWEDSDRGAGNKAKKRAGGKVEKKSPTYLAHVHNKEEVELDEAERSVADRLERKRKLYKKTTRKAMDDARNTGEASGHNRFNMSRLGREMDKLGDRNEDYHSGTGEKVVARTKKWMDKKGQKGAPGLDAMKARTAEHKAKRGVKEDFIREVNVEDSNPNSNKKKIDVMKGKNKIKLMPNVKEQIDKEKEKEDPAIAQKQKQATMLKKRVLMQKLKAVRGGAGESIMAHNKPKGEVIEGVGISTADKMKKAKEEASLRKKEQDKIKQKTNEQKECDCDCGQDPCIKCGESHHNIKTEALLNLVKNRLKLKGLNMSHQPQPKLVEKIKDKVKESDFVTESLSALKFTVK